MLCDGHFDEDDYLRDSNTIEQYFAEDLKRETET